ncbi:MAG: hypothetical protein EOP10_08080 [Proteobacteria bacterium]|nr:MAG: hypothetical protein EOP10_08080 [Pseudomonadota bacterium]
MTPIEAQVTANNQVSVKRISWPAIFAGVVVVLVVQLALSLLGLGIGASTIDPLAQQNPLSGMGTGSGIWLVVSTLIALFVGGWIAGRVSGMHNKVEGSIHGFLTWGLATLVTTYLLATVMGGMVRGAGNMLGGAASLVGQGLKTAAPAIGDAVSGQLSAQGIDLNSITAEAKTLLSQTAKPELQPNAIENQAERTQAQVEGGVTQAAKNPQNAEAELTQIWNRVMQNGKSTLEAADKEALVNVLVARSSMSPEEATTVVNRWESTYAAAKVKFDQTKVQAEQKAREAGDKAAENISKGAIWSFVALVLGGLAAAFGGLFGALRAPYSLPVLTEANYRRPIVQH